MTPEQIEKMRALLFQVQTIVRHAEESDTLPYRLAVAIGVADDMQSECFQFVGFCPPQPAESK